MKRLLCIVSAMNTGGAETFLMKLYREIDRTQYQMDFCVNIFEKGFYDDEIESLGGKIYHIPAKSANVREYRKQLFQIVKDGRYKSVLRITSSAAGFLDLKIAKKAGAERCCARSSNSSDGKSLTAKIAHRLGRLLYGQYVDVKIAPSDLAARYTFGKKAYKQGKVNILHNAVDLSVYQYSVVKRQQIREEFQLSPDTLLIGHIGRFDVQKNHGFLIHIFEQISKRRSNAKLLLVGKGPLETEVRSLVQELGIEEKVIFAGIRSDVPGIMSAMDVLVFPSLYEGMPNVVIESQATGLPCVISDTITKEADITGLVGFYNLSDDYSVWADAAVQKADLCRASRTEQLKEAKYDIGSVAADFIKLTMGE